MQSKTLFIMIFLMIAGIGLAGCADQKEPPLPTLPPPMVELLPTNTPLPTSTPRPPTSTPLPTAGANEIAEALTTPVSALDPSVAFAPQLDPYTITGSSGRTEVINYTVKAGDTLSQIAARFELDICTLVWSNPRNRISPIRPDYLLEILPVNGVFYQVQSNITIQEIANKTGVSPYTIIDSPYNDLLQTTPETVLVEGMKVVIPNGNGGDCNVWAAAPQIYSGSGTHRSGSLLGCSYSVETPGAPVGDPLPEAVRTSQEFSGGHPGLDLAAKTGSPVYSAGGGSVAYAGWSDLGYGNVIVIDHGGTYTLYGHLSEIDVQCGQQVGGGEVIGDVGSTGHSSGPHLHFEVRDGHFDEVDPTYLHNH